MHIYVCATVCVPTNRLTSTGCSVHSNVLKCQQLAKSITSLISCAVLALFCILFIAYFAALCSASSGHTINMATRFVIDSCPASILSFILCTQNQFFSIFSIFHAYEWARASSWLQVLFLRQLFGIFYSFAVLLLRFSVLQLANS